MSLSDLTPILPLLLVSLWAIILLVVDLFVRRKGTTALLAAGGLLLALVVLIIQSDDQQAVFNGMLVADSYAGFLQAIFLVTGLLGIAVAYDYLRRMGIERGEYYPLLLFTISGMMLMSLAGDLIVVFVALELLSLPLYVLAGFARPRPESEEAAMKYFLLGAFASGFLVYGIALVFGATGTTNLAGIAAELSGGAGLLLVGAVLVLVGLSFKVAAVPFHMWTPDVYQGAPSAVVAFMSVGAKAGGFAALLRVFIAALPDLAAAWAPLTMGLAALTMTWGNVAAIVQGNIKRMLAYSSIAHAGYILIALPAASLPAAAPGAVSAALFYLFAYLFSNLGAWAVVLAVERLEGGGLQIDDYSGLSRRRPGLALAMALFMLSLTGLPPTVGFVGKFFIFRAALDAGQIGLALVGVLTSLISAYYYLRVVVVMYMRTGEPETRSEGWLNATIGVTALATFVFGVLPGPILALAEHSEILGLLR
ncbi:MAG TPA: NADH-quinone oxidoreductase subunit N [Anaerolineales bacterium]|nr:NADH-quinone oxidoreductase subunit N [Anaerolineales bacterium]